MYSLLPSELSSEILMKYDPSTFQEVFFTSRKQNQLCKNVNKSYFNDNFSNKIMTFCPYNTKQSKKS